MESTLIHFSLSPARSSSPTGFIRSLVLLDEFGFHFSSESPQTFLSESASKEGFVWNFSGEKPAFFIRESESGLFSLQSQNGEYLLESADFFTLIKSYFVPNRVAQITRKTAETDIDVTVNLDGTGVNDIKTGLGFFDHMLEQIARHGLIDVKIHCRGDLHIDEHHTIEDTGLALGECLAKAIGDKRGIERYSWALPMDETLALVSLDLSGRPALQFESELRREKVGDFPVEMTKHFFYSIAMAMKVTLQMKVTGENDHHQIEALFKGFARCLRGSVSRNPRIRKLVPSSKGIL